MIRSKFPTWTTASLLALALLPACATSGRVDDLEKRIGALEVTSKQNAEAAAAAERTAQEAVQRAEAAGQEARRAADAADAAARKAEAIFNKSIRK